MAGSRAGEVRAGEVRAGRARAGTRQCLVRPRGAPAAPGGRTIGGRYRLDERLAAGGAGEVWRARDVALGRPVAVKLLRPEGARDAGTLARFRAEARHAGMLSHENVPRIFDYDERPGPDPPFMVMELVSGPSVGAVLAAGPMDPARVADIIAQAAAGLAAAHRAGLVHGDIRPGSLLLAPGDVVKITNFGLSRAAAATGAPAAGLDGEAQPGPGDDLYSLGLVAHACLAGGAVRTGATGPPAGARPDRDRRLPPLPGSVPSALAALVAGLTAGDPAARPGSAAEVARRAGELRSRMTHGIPGPVPVGRWSVPAPDRARRVPASAGRWSARAPAGPWSVPVPAGPRGAPPLSPGPGWPPARGRRLRRAALGTGMAVAAMMGLILANGPGAAAPGRVVHVPTSAAAPPAPGNTALTVRVSSRSLIGHPVGAVLRRLHRLGFRVRVRWEHSGWQPPGTVLAVQPGGRLAPGRLITLTGALHPQSGPQVQPKAPPARLARSSGHPKQATPGTARPGPRTGPGKAGPGPHHGPARPGPGRAPGPGVPMPGLHGGPGKTRPGPHGGINAKPPGPGWPGVKHHWHATLLGRGEAE